MRILRNMRITTQDGEQEKKCACLFVSYKNISKKNTVTISCGVVDILKDLINGWLTNLVCHSPPVAHD